MRIVVLGNCQSHGIGHGLAHLLPEARVEVAQLNGPADAPRAQVARRLVKDCDIVFTQRLDARYGALGTQALAGTGKPVVPVPKIIFRGYQPDIAYLEVGGQTKYSPIGAYHSSIVAAAFSLGVAEADVPMLFNRLVYARLGHFDVFGKARTLLAEELAAFGPDFVACFDSWHARGPFMHTLNHPRVFVLADIARVAAIRAGLLPADAPPVVLAFDHLAGNTIWPVYPEIAETLGVPAGLVFKRAVTPAATAHVLHLGLTAFIRESYASYARLPAEAFRSGAIGEARQPLAAFLGCDPG